MFLFFLGIQQPPFHNFYGSFSLNHREGVQFDEVGLAVVTPADTCKQPPGILFLRQSYNVAEYSLELSTFFCLCHPSTRSTGMRHHYQMKQYFPHRQYQTVNPLSYF